MEIKQKAKKLHSLVLFTVYSALLCSSLIKWSISVTVLSSNLQGVMGSICCIWSYLSHKYEASLLTFAKKKCVPLHN